MGDKSTRKPPSQWHAVTVVLRTSSCAAAALCRNRRFLSREAPRLPLPDCSHPSDCHCTFRHLEDRRTGLRRSSDLGRSSDKPEVDQRKSRGRRSRDQR